jgi:hypothetical protein
MNKRGVNFVIQCSGDCGDEYKSNRPAAYTCAACCFQKGQGSTAIVRVVELPYELRKGTKGSGQAK